MPRGPMILTHINQIFDSITNQEVRFISTVIKVGLIVQLKTANMVQPIAALLVGRCQGVPQQCLSVLDGGTHFPPI